MARTRWRRRCTARRTDGRPCDAWAMTGGRVCRAHGGAAPQTRRAASERQVMARIDREIAAAQKRLDVELADWWTSRVCWAAEVLDRDPVELGREMRSLPGVSPGAYLALLLIEVDWPPGLRLEDEPQLGRARGSRSKT